MDYEVLSLAALTPLMIGILMRWQMINSKSLKQTWALLLIYVVFCWRWIRFWREFVFSGSGRWEFEVTIFHAVVFVCVVSGGVLLILATASGLRNQEEAKELSNG